MTGADRQWTVQYELGDIVRYTRASQAMGVLSTVHAHVTAVDREQKVGTFEPFTDCYRHRSLGLAFLSDQDARLEGAI